MWDYAAILIVGVMAGVSGALYFVHRQRAKIRETFATLAPQLRGVPKKADPSELLETIASSYSALLAQSTKDKAQLLTILSAMSDALIAVDSKQLVLLVNHAAEQFFSMRGAEAVGRPLWDVVRNKEVLEAVQGVMLTGERSTSQISGVEGRGLAGQSTTASNKGKDPHPDPLPEYREREEEKRSGQSPTLQEEKRATQVSPLQEQQRGKDGNGIVLRNLEVTVARLPRTDQPAGLVIVAHDMTEITRYENLRKEFVANVSHELRTPLTMIKGFVETLRDGAIDDRPRALQYLETVQRHSDQLTNLVSDLLDLSRFDSGLEIPRGGIVHAEAMIRRAVELMMPAAQKKGHKLTVNVEANLPAIAGNGDYLQRAVGNLVENAVKYTGDGGAIEVRAESREGMVSIEVVDSGIGIAADDLPRIFERFYRVDRSRSREMGGTGLGLSIVKHVVQAHGGAVEVTSVLNQGSTFRINLPAVSKQAQMPAVA